MRTRAARMLRALAARVDPAPPAAPKLVTVYPLARSGPAYASLCRQWNSPHGRS